MSTEIEPVTGNTENDRSLYQGAEPDNNAPDETDTIKEVKVQTDTSDKDNNAGDTAVSSATGGETGRAEGGAADTAADTAKIEDKLEVVSREVKTETESTGKEAKTEAENKEAKSETVSTEAKSETESKENKTEAESTGKEDKAEIVSEGDNYTVEKGDCLWNIAKAHYGSGFDYVKIYEANRGVIGDNPNLIYPGTQLVLP
ncbi:MAG: LysM peptidoglycan-binding domain-containing protein [Lachnospiraceae bacterium]|nr:LysM peptidoglycan-binding domain-containing protein [Lachnospiraceae bacterium]